MRRVLGADHPDTLGARWILALWTAEAGDAAADRGQFAALLPTWIASWELTTPPRSPRA